MTDELRAKRVPSTTVVLAVCGAMLTGCGAHTHHATESKDQGKRQRALPARAYALRTAQAERQVELAARAATLLQKAAPLTPSAVFAALPAGWRSYQDAGAVATSWAYAPGKRPGGPADYMPTGGIIVNVTYPTARTKFKPLRLVLPRRPTTMLEGTKDTLEYRIEGRTHGTNVLIYVDIRNPHPTVPELRIAERVVSAIRFH